MVNKLTIRLYKQYEKIADFDIPEHRHGPKDLFNLMRTIYASQVASKPEDLARFFVNKRRGSPPWDTTLDLRPIYSDDNCETGHELGTSQLFVTATRRHSLESYESLKRLWAQNKTKG